MATADIHGRFRRLLSSTSSDQSPEPHERERGRGDAEQGGVLVTATSREEAAGRVNGRCGDHRACGRRAGCGRGETERDEDTAACLTQSCGECALFARPETHLFESGAVPVSPCPPSHPNSF